MPGAAKDPPRKPKPGPDGRVRAAFRRPAAVAVFLLVVAAALAADLGSKEAVFLALLRDPGLAERVGELAAGPTPLAPDEALRALHLHRRVFWGFRLTLSTNPGVVFGLPMPPWSVAVATVITIGLVGYFFATCDAAARWTHVALAMILSGAVGNFYDRMLTAVCVPGLQTPITGQVRDFLDFSEIRVFGVNYPYIFNVADVWLVVGVAMLILHWWAAAWRQRKSKAADGGARRRR